VSGVLDMSLAAAAQAVAARRVSSLELTQAALDRAAQLQPKFNAFVRIDADLALAAARACDAETAQGKSRGPLHGVPLAHKDMFYRRGKVSTCGSKIRADWVADTTAAVLERLDAAGAIQIGTLNMTEFAYGPTGQNAYLFGRCPQSLESGAYHWRFIRRLGGIGGIPHCVRRARLRYRRVGTHAGGAVWCDGHENHFWPRLARRLHAAFAIARYRRPSHPHRRGQRLDAVGHSRCR